MDLSGSGLWCGGVCVCVGVWVCGCHFDGGYEEVGLEFGFVSVPWDCCCRG